MADVFISYSRDDRDRAAVFAKALASRQLSVWWDRNIPPGKTFDETIERELNSATSVLVLWSKTSVTSEWVKIEAAAAAERSVLVPVLIDRVKIPLEFSRRQAADLVGWDGDPDAPAFVDVLNAIVANRGGAPIQPVAQIAVERGPARANPAWVKQRGIKIAAFAVAAMAVAGTVWFLTRAPEPVPNRNLKLFVQIASTQDRGKYTALKSSLAEFPFAVDGPEVMNATISGNQIRYCNADNGPDANRLKTILESKRFNTFTVTNIRNCDAAKNHDILEIWLQSGN